MISSSPKTTRRGFTLVEMLVVIAIIGILVGLITAGAAMAIKIGRETVIVTDMTQLDLALKAYKDKYGEYPPDGTDRTDANNDGIPDAFARHFQRVFPKANLAMEPAGKPYVSELGRLCDLYGFSCDPKDINALRQFFLSYNPTSALTFWLGGMQESDYLVAKNVKSRFVGFSANPIQPLSDPSNSRLPMLFEFDTAKVNDAANAQTITFFRSYLANTNIDKPYVYFRADPNQKFLEYSDYTIAGRPLKFYPLDNQIVRPYFSTEEPNELIPGRWVNPTSYQIIFCGFDGKFGKGNFYPNGRWPDGQDPKVDVKTLRTNWKLLFFKYIPDGDTDRTNYNYDDITNFSGGTLGKKMP